MQCQDVSDVFCLNWPRWSVLRKSLCCTIMPPLMWLKAWCIFISTLVIWFSLVLKNALKWLGTWLAQIWGCFYRQQDVLLFFKKKEYCQIFPFSEKRGNWIILRPNSLVLLSRWSHSSPDFPGSFSRRRTSCKTLSVAGQTGCLGLASSSHHNIPSPCYTSVQSRGLRSVSVDKQFCTTMPSFNVFCKSSG